MKARDLTKWREMKLFIGTLKISLSTIRRSLAFLRNSFKTYVFKKYGKNILTKLCTSDPTLEEIFVETEQQILLESPAFTPNRSTKICILC